MRYEINNTSLRSTTKLFLIAAVLCAFTTVAFADQAEWVTRAQAEAAVKILQTKNMVKHFCAPCRDVEPRDEVIQSVTLEKVKDSQDDHWTVLVNGKSIDLAYVYFEEKKDKWKNMAMHLDIEVNDVPKYLKKDK